MGSKLTESCKLNALTFLIANKEILKGSNVQAIAKINNQSQSAWLGITKTEGSAGERRESNNKNKPPHNNSIKVTDNECKWGVKRLFNDPKMATKKAEPTPTKNPSSMPLGIPPTTKITPGIVKIPRLNSIKRKGRCVTIGSMIATNTAPNAIQVVATEAFDSLIDQ